MFIGKRISEVYIATRRSTKYKMCCRDRRRSTHAKKREREENYAARRALSFQPNFERRAKERGEESDGCNSSDSNKEQALLCFAAAAAPLKAINKPIQYKSTTAAAAAAVV